MNINQLNSFKMKAGFGKEPVVSDLEVVVSGGEIVVIAGPNGVGKSTIVKVLSRQLKPMEGNVFFNGNDVWKMTPMEFARQVAYVPQSMETGHDMTVEEIVMLGRNPHQNWWQWYGSQSDRDAVDAALAATELSGLRSKSLAELSGGERQRAAIATALAQDPAFMLLDEPTAHLDFRHQLELVSLLQSLRDKKGIGCLLVLHDLNLIARAADRVVLLQKQPGAPSKIAATGAPPAVLTRENLQRVFEVEVQIHTDPESGETFYNAIKSTATTT
ncbi:MAG TPA: ABC transporter ATP-binding protein [Planktothrix sp.]|jgi:iron complex transport system ATP-binding protein